jgi:hypothetical protein
VRPDEVVLEIVRSYQRKSHQRRPHQIEWRCSISLRE